MVEQIVVQFDQPQAISQLVYVVAHLPSNPGAAGLPTAAPPGAAWTRPWSR
jgi:hypothetical protein